MDFDARVIGMPDYVKLVKDGLGKDEAQFAADKFTAARQKLLAKKPEFKNILDDLYRRKGPMVSHVHCERHAFLKPLQDWATHRDGTTPELVLKDNAWTGFLHLAILGFNDALILPFDFPVPYEVKMEERSFVFPVCSGTKILAELELANKTLKVEKAFRFPSIPDFFRAQRKEMSRLEQQEGLDSAFWVKFGLVVLRHLVKKSVTFKLPIIFAEKAAEPVA